MYLLLTIALISIVLGCTLKSILSHLLSKWSVISSCSRSPLQFSDSSSTSGSRVVGMGDPYFDPFKIYITSDTNNALEAIFDIIIDRYILSWYRTLSDNDDFIVQVRLTLQHLSAVLISRMKSVKPASVLWDYFLRFVVDHVEHIYPLLSSDKHIDSLVDDVVLRNLGSHLHVCLFSRPSELGYLRALVNRLLPLVSLPPGLISKHDDHLDAASFSDFRSFRAKLISPVRKPSIPAHEANNSYQLSLPRSLSAGLLHSKSNPPVTLGANRAAYSFLVEVLSTCVLLPAMDTVANPDFINKAILQCLSEQTVSSEPDINASEEVPVLRSYVEYGNRWISEKPTYEHKLENILHNRETCFSFIQYMKSIKSTVPVTAVLLMREIDQRVRNDSLPPDACREIRTQVYHVLILVSHSANLTSDDGFEVGTLSNMGDGSSGSRLFGLSDEFGQLLAEFLEFPTTSASLFRLIDSPVWNQAYQRAYDTLEHRFLPLYLESPEYLMYRFGVSVHQKAVSSGNHSSVRHGSQTSSSIFGFPLKAIFTNNVVEGRVLSNSEQEFNKGMAYSSNRSQRGASVRNNTLRSSATSQFEHGNALTIDSQHQLHSHYVLHAPRQIDMCGWHAFIPGLSRPEIRPSRRLIDQLVVPSGSSVNGNDSRSFYSTRPHDGAFRDKVTNELLNLQSNTLRTPLLSPQFLFTVRTEHMVNGVWQPIERVDRKYSEFYTLEQKLLEFHGNAITRQLPRKQFTPRTFDFLESKREVFEEYLQYLLTQPFLRSSELLHRFLTSKSAFSSNVLFELNLGRFAKSVPLKLIRERGQYLDNFLVSFYLSCNPQPIMLESIIPEPSSSAVMPVISVGAGVGTLGGIDALSAPDQFQVSNTTVRSAQTPVTTQPTDPHVSVAPGLPQQSRLVAPNSSTERRGPKRTWLDNRLRMKMFWNNAGLTVDRRRELHGMHCTCETLKLNGISELSMLILKNLIEPVAELQDETLLDVHSTAVASRSDLVVSDSSRPQSCSPGQLEAVNPWDIGDCAWNEALLNGPTLLPIQSNTVTSFVTSKEPFHPLETEKSQQPKLEQPISEQSSVSTENVETVSISFADITHSFRHLTVVLKQHLLVRTRQFILWVLHILCRFFPSHLNRWLCTLFERTVKETLTDHFMASGLRLLKSALFYPLNPSTDLEKAERKVQANLALKHFVSNSRLSVLFDSEKVEENLDRLFTCFQHPKLNKQLSYVLLDRLVLALFPELSSDSND